MPEYNLSEVHEAIRNERLRYQRTVQSQVIALEYEFYDVKQCLLSLTENNFHKTLSYDNKRPHDVYKVRYPNPNNEEELDHLYIKFYMCNGHLTLTLASFHL